MSLSTPAATPSGRPPRWVGPALLALVAAVVVLLGLLAASIMERRWEAQQPALIVRPLAEWEPDNAAWGENYPREHESYLRTRGATTRTKFGGSFPRDYLDEDPLLVVLYGGSAFSKDYRQARGHYYSVQDVAATKRVGPATVGTCWTCKSTDVPRLMAAMGAKEFYAAKFDDLRPQVAHPIGCQDCHDPRTMTLRITRPALRDALAARARRPEDAAHQEMRSLVCAQCHAEYYFREGTHLVFPWAKGLSVEEMIAYYDEHNFTDYTHAVSKAAIVKAQHPDYELYASGIHAYRGVACADCHMPYRTEGAVKFTSHHVQSPLLDVAVSCAVCHRWSEEEIRARVEVVQAKTAGAKASAEKALAAAHFDVAAAAQAGSADADLAGARRLIRHAQFRWDYVASSNGMGFHSPQEAMRILGEAMKEAQESRLLAARLLARRGVAAEPKHPDVSTREKAAAVVAAFAEGRPPSLLP